MAYKLTKVNNNPGEFISVDTDDIPELQNATNLWYTQQRVDADVLAHRQSVPTLQDKHFYTVGEIATKQGDLFWQIISPIEIISTQAVLQTAPAGSNAQFDIVKNLGSNPSDTLFSLTLSPGSTFVESNTAPVQLAAGDYIRVDVLQIGNVSPGSDLTISFKYRSII